jgi:S1-C subfamily serine protease
MSFRVVVLVALWVSLCLFSPVADADPPLAQKPVSSAAERIYEAARPRLLQVRTIVADSDKQSTLGSAFVVSADGLAITNYHVVSQYALEPETYRLEYAGADGSHGGLTLLAVDVADDLAVVRLDHPPAEFFTFDPQALDGTVPKGEMLYAMGNPLDLGFSIVEGTYNGPVQRYYLERLHFSGALNPGMSGGPTVSADGRVVGVNVSKQVNSELVSFLVPARFAAALLERAASAPQTPLAGAGFRAEIGRQLDSYQAGLQQGFTVAGFRSVAFGPYQAPESAADWLTCWGQTNADQAPPPRASLSRTSCQSSTGLFIANDLGTGTIRIAHSYMKSTDLNPFQFASFVQQVSQMGAGFYQRKWHTHLDCSESFVQPEPAADHPSLRVTWCARAYRNFPGLYDVSLAAVTQDRSEEALVSRLSVEGVSWDNAIGLTRRFLDGIKWTK